MESRLSVHAPEGADHTAQRVAAAIQAPLVAVRSIAICVAVRRAQHELIVQPIRDGIDQNELGRHLPSRWSAWSRRLAWPEGGIEGSEVVVITPRLVMPDETYRAASALATLCAAPAPICWGRLYGVGVDMIVAHLRERHPDHLAIGCSGNLTVEILAAELGLTAA